MITDIHTHIFDEQIYDDYFKKVGHRVDRVISIYHWLTEDKAGNQVAYELDELLALAQSKKNLFVIGAINIEKDIQKQLERLEDLLKNKKIVGIKMYPAYQYFYPSDELVHPVAELCQKYDKPLVFHSGDVFDMEGKAILKYSHPIHVDALAVAYPNCKIIIAHFGFPYNLETANVVSKNKNVYTDISGTIDVIDNKKQMKILRDQYIVDLKRACAYFPDVKKKTMFGTDYSGESTALDQVSGFIDVMNKLFSKEERESVSRALAQKLFFD